MTESRYVSSLDELAIALKDGWVIELRKRNTKSLQAEKPKPVRIPACIRWKVEKGFDWDFARETNGEVLEEAKEFVELLRHGSFTQDGCRYSLSKDEKFLQRAKLPR